MHYQKAVNIAADIKSRLLPFCDQIEIAGSIRRRRPMVHDIDIVCIPSNQGQFAYQIQSMGTIKAGGGKLIRLKLAETDVDFYIADPQTWATLLLIRTGSKEHNIFLCRRARDRSMRLHADGSGLFRLGGMVATDDAADGDLEEIRIAGDTEASIFEALGLKYKEPWEREL
jgi:DNA polymerase (family 10)